MTIKRILIGLAIAFLAFLLLAAIGFQRLGQQIYGGYTTVAKYNDLLGTAAPTLIRNANVLSPTGDSFLVAHSVLLEDGRIRAIGKDLTAPAGTKVIDANGRYLTPGLIDAHVHLWKSPNDLLLYLANGVTGIREMIGEPAHLEWKSAIAAGQRPGPRMYVASPRLGSFGTFEGYMMAKTQGFANASDPAEAEEMVRDFAAAGYDGIKLYSHLSRESYDALTAAGKKLGVPTFGHVPWAVPLEDVYISGQSGVAHFEELANVLRYEYEHLPEAEQPADVLEHVRTRGPEVAARLRENNITVTSTLWLTESFDDQKRNLDSVLRSVQLAYENPGIAEWSSYIPGGLGWLPGVNRYQIQDQLNEEELVGRLDYWKSYGTACTLLAVALHEGGVTLLAGTDANLTPTVPGFSLHSELAALAAAGLSNEEVLRAATASPAKYLGWEAGVLREGAVADLLLLDANPLEDISATERIAAVVSAGVHYDRAALDEMLARVKAANAESRTVSIEAYE